MPIFDAWGSLAVTKKRPTEMRLTSPPRMGKGGLSAQANRSDSLTVAPKPHILARPLQPSGGRLLRSCCAAGIDGCRGVDYHSKGALR